MEAAAVLAGLLTGIVVGMTGIGGGALMTPILVFLIGVAPATAVGTDLLFATLTKVVAVGFHRSRGTIDWPIVRRLARGSVPTAAAMVFLLHYLSGQQRAAGVIMPALGIALTLTALAMIGKRPLHALGRRWRTRAAPAFKSLQPRLTVAAGVAIGAVVTLTSIGAGALGTVMLVYLYPFRLTPARLVATDLAHAIPVALVAGLGHLAVGNVDFPLLGALLLGSLPGVWIGSHLSLRAPEPALRTAIAAILLIVGAKILGG
ncbi:MAG: sulfite exporter TauE/SafE family protein [Candidatus Rokubacteria bacterium]|nr:sulfite exporter TauE/SafE family protein [Candidatus Rokubacteria bacterium]